MMNWRSGSLLILAVVLLALSCGKQPEPSGAPSPADMLVANIDSLGLVRTTEVRVFIGDSLWEYINGGAELYHLYNFVDVATADYDLDGTELVADIYRFDTPENAYGLYTQLRPATPHRVQLGVEGFVSPTNLVFVKGRYVVTLTAFEQGEQVNQALNTMATLLAEHLDGTEYRPGKFALLPAEGAVEASDMMHAQSFFGQAFLTDVYSQKYNLNGDTLLLFLTDDQSGEKLIEWKERIQGPGETEPAPENIAFDEGLALRYTDSYYGNIVAGLVGGRLVGIAGYRDKYSAFLAGWIDTLTRQTP